jgi:protease-3
MKSLLVLVALASGSVASAADYFADMAARRNQVTPTQTASLHLENGVTVYLVSTAVAQAAISMRVGAGQYNSPRQYRGLAHYLEHCLFLGSQKYPTPEQLMQFAETNQGYANAFTANDNTNYQLVLNSNALEEAADRMSDAVVAPLFDQSAVASELKKIQSEYDKNVDSPGWQEMYLAQQVFRDDHPAGYDFQGNDATLGNIPRAVVQKFFEENYSGRNISVVIESPESLAKMEDIAKRTFGRIPNRNIVTISPPLMVQARKRPPTLFKGSTVVDQPTLTFTYTLPPVAPTYWATRDFDLVESALSDLQEGSFGDALRAKGWLKSIDAGDSAGDALGNRVEIALTLTQEGYKHWQEIGSALLAQIEYMKKAGLSRNGFFNTQRSAELNYLYGSVDLAGDVVSLAEVIPYFGTSYTREKESLLARSDAKTYQQAINSLTTDHLDVFLMAADIKGDQTTDFYNISYNTEALASQAWLKPQTLAGFTPQDEAPNPYLPKSLDVIAQQDDQPQEVVNTPLLRARLQRDNTFKVPKADLSLVVHYGGGYKPSALEAMHNVVFASYLNFVLRAWASPIGKVGYTVAVSSQQGRLDLAVIGYAEGVPRLTTELLKRIASVQIQPDAFANVMADLKANAANRANDDAGEQAMFIRTLEVDPTGYTDRTEASLLDQVTLQSLQDFKNRALREGNIDLAVMGSLGTEQVSTLAQELAQALPMKAVATPTFLTTQDALGTNSYAATRTGANNYWLTGFELGPMTAENLAEAQLLNALVSSAFFNFMRVEKNFGYIAASYPTMGGHAAKISFYVQSLVDSVEVARVGREWFRDGMLPLLQNQSDADFAAARAALVQKLLQKPDSLDAKFAPLSYDVIFDGFPQTKDVAAAAAKLTKEKIVNDVKNLILGDQRREFQIYLNSKSQPVIPAGENVVHSLEEYWQSTGNYELKRGGT